MNTFNESFYNQAQKIWIDMAKDGNTETLSIELDIIADALYISIHTINNHRKNILQKTGCKNVPTLVAETIRLNRIK